MPDVSNPRLGNTYNAATWAAAHPIWFHPMYDGQLLEVVSRLWTDAAPIGGTPGAYSAFTESTTPSWCILDGPTGRRTAVPNPMATIPTIPLNTTATSVTVVAAVSRPPAALHLLYSATVSGQDTAILQRIGVNPNGSAAVTHEEVLPVLGKRSDNGEYAVLPFTFDAPIDTTAPSFTPTAIPTATNTVIFNRGVQIETPFIYVYGGDSAGNVYRIRKTWGKVGINRQFRATPQIHSGLAGTQVGWEYFTGTGYSPDPAGLAHIPDLLSVGPLSFASFRNRTFLSTVTATGTARFGRVWTSTAGRPWIQTGAPVPLGDTATGTYLDGGIQFQPLLGASPSASAMTSTVLAGIPYVVTTKISAGGGDALNTAWYIWPVSV